MQSEVSLEEVRQLYEQIIEGKDELIRSKDTQLEFLGARITELLAEIKRLRGE
jgi:hypothetical protein